MADLETYTVTFNCGRTPIDTDFFAAHLFDDLKQDAPLDLIVLCLQEVAPIAYSFLSASMMAAYTSRFETAVTSALRSKYTSDIADDFLLMQLRNVGMTAIMLFARRDLVARIGRIDTAGVGTGLWEMGNKGAVGLRLWMDDGVPVSLISAHLAPMEKSWERRNQDWRSICERLVFTRDSSFVKDKPRSSEDEPLLGKDTDVYEDSEQGMFSPIAPVVFAGDLNYRTSDKKPQPEDHKDWPSPHESEDFTAMLEQDQLSRERAGKRSLHLMDEAKITFPPTYKYSSQAQKQAKSLVTSTTTNTMLWAEHRIPSWCDRVLFLTASRPEVHSYTVLPIQPTSDHRPVALAATIAVERVNTGAKPPFSIDKDWRSKRAAARSLELLVGIGAYLTLTYEGNAVLAATLVAIVGGGLTIRALG